MLTVASCQSTQSELASQSTYKTIVKQSKGRHQIMRNKRYNLNRLAPFVAVIEEGTMTAAAERLGISKAVVSKQLLTLEDELGVSLLVRNSRHLSATEVGQEFYRGAKAALDQANEVFETAIAGLSEPQGMLRMTAPVDYGTLHVSRLVANFTQRYPRVEVDVTLSDEQFDPVGQNFDIAFRVGWLADSSNRARKIGSFREVVVCTPEAAGAEVVIIPKDLEGKAFVANTALSDQAQLIFNQNGKSVSVTTDKTITMNVGPAILSTVCAGGGYSVLPDFLVQDELASGKLVQLLPDWSLRTGGIYAVFPPVKFRNLSTQAFLDMAIEYHRNASWNSANADATMTE